MTQHAWEARFRADALGRPLAPRFHRLLMLDVTGEPDPPALEAALRGLEAESFMLLGWGARWFERVGPSPIGRPVPMAPWEDPVLEEIDACLHVAGEDEDRVAAVQRRFPLAGLSLREVRTGFTGPNLPVRGVAPDAPLLLGFHSGLRGNQASEAEITIPDGPLAGGTTMHVSRIALDVERWHAQDPETRAALMFSPATTARAAARFTDDARADADRLPALAAQHGLVGHAQAAGRARLHGRPRINRRDFATVDGGVPGTHFVSLQRTLQDFNVTRAVMNAADARHHHPRIGLRERNGLNAFMEVRSRATFAVPPRSARAFPRIVDA